MNKKIGIIGGGQLGKMILDETNKIDLEVSILDPNKNSPCKNLTKNFIQGDFNDFDTVLNFGLAHDIISYEIEHINVDALDELVSKGIEVQPSPEILRIIQDKNLQKSFFKENNFPTSDFSYFNSKNDLLNSFKKSNLSFPCVWKKTKFGYDGFGVKILNTKNDFSKLPDAEMIIEDKKKASEILILKRNNS